MSYRFKLCGLLLVAAISSGMILVEAKGQTAADQGNPAATPTPRKNKAGKNDENWMKRHDGFVAIAKKGDVPILFHGDSITDGWRNKYGKATWEKYFLQWKAENFGIGGDKTEEVLWRLQNGELDGIKPKLVVLMIGTNNTGGKLTAEQIAGGITAIVKTIHDKSKDTKVLLLAVFPRGEKPGTPIREKIANINKIIAKLDDGGKTVKYMDIGDKFLKPDGTLPKDDTMYDFLHPNAKGYEVWAAAINDTVLEMAGIACDELAIQPERLK